MTTPFHACATCIHFRAVRENGKMGYYCGRLGYETKTNYQFQCWEPKPEVRKLMEKRKQGKP
ncbi:hypothetical protein WQ57_13035 [Mesobacillus campisalis]|uniref:Uncharacterized protein n=1 Tax=Mesobacillus campisalis TaxID=1408103 RepID=A0A0M2SYF8_9BACI|nr:hypothetical protein [Mesobacillus campisalis]KKK37650.1 hypothetical protein WQ57_13035 [Mesobacillus campisalis]